MDIKYEDRFGLYGLMAEFETPETLLNATEEAFKLGFRKMDAYTPFPVEGLASALGSKFTWVSTIIGLGGLFGACGGFFLMWWITVIAYPVNVGGRPFNSWPAYIPITFECAVLIASLTAVFGMLALNGFPEPYHPVFNVPRFQLSSVDRFFLCIEARDPLFHLDRTREFLEGLGAQEVAEVAK
jgi:hypothetical protein